MNITRETDYALRVVYLLSKAKDGEKISASQISKIEKIPSQFLLKILRKLRQGGLIKSYMGVKGGYTLKKDPEDISLKDVIEIINGPIHLNTCLLDKENCNKYPRHCSIHIQLGKIQDNLLEDLEKVNFKNIDKFDLIN